MVLHPLRCFSRFVIQGKMAQVHTNLHRRWGRPLHLLLMRHQTAHLSPLEGLQTPRIRASSALRVWIGGLCRLGAGGVLLAALPYSPVGSKDKTVSSPTGSLQDSAASLSHAKLIKNAAAIAVDSSCVLLTHCALAAISFHKEYAQMVNKLVVLMEDHAQFVGTPSQEDELWQDIIRQRVEIDDQLQAMEDADVMLSSAILVVERAAEAAYQADAELSTMTAGQHLHLVQAQIDAVKKISQKAKEELTNIQAKAIKESIEGTDGDTCT